MQAVTVTALAELEKLRLQEFKQLARSQTAKVQEWSCPTIADYTESPWKPYKGRLKNNCEYLIIFKNYNNRHITKNDKCVQIKEEYFKHFKS